MPFFAAVIDGVPDFRVAGPAKLRRCVRERLCWVCGEKLGAMLAFAIGPMCAVNRISGEPPAHRECAVYSATHCPFLTSPRMRRNEKGIDQLGSTNPGYIGRNPGATLVWITRRYSVVPNGRGMLFQVGEPVELLWFAEGKPATRAQIMASIESGLPILRESAEADGPEAVAHLDRLVARAMTLLPGEADLA